GRLPREQLRAASANGRGGGRSGRTRQAAVPAQFAADAASGADPAGDLPRVAGAHGLAAGTDATALHAAPGSLDGEESTRAAPDRPRRKVMGFTVPRRGNHESAHRKGAGLSGGAAARTGSVPRLQSRG